MNLSEKILSYGLTEEMIRFYHARTRLGEMEIESVEFYATVPQPSKNPTSILLKLRLKPTRPNVVVGRVTTMQISISKIRQKKINLLLGE